MDDEVSDVLDTNYNLLNVRMVYLVPDYLFYSNLSFIIYMPRLIRRFDFFFFHAMFIIDSIIHFLS